MGEDPSLHQTGGQKEEAQPGQGPRWAWQGCGNPVQVSTRGPFSQGQGLGLRGRGCQEEGRVGWPSQRVGTEALLPASPLEPWDTSLVSLPLGQPAHTLQVGGLLFKNGTDPITLLTQKSWEPSLDTCIAQSHRLLEC